MVKSKKEMFDEIRSLLEMNNKKVDVSESDLVIFDDNTEQQFGESVVVDSVELDDNPDLIILHHSGNSQWLLSCDDFSKYELELILDSVKDCADTYMSEDELENIPDAAKERTAIKMHDVTEMETVNLFLSQTATPLAYQAKLKELLDSGAFETEAEAVEYLNTTPIELEIYYESGYGLFAVEAEAVETELVSSPYSQKKILNI